MASKSHSWRHSTSIRLLAMNRMIYPRRNEREEEEEEEEKEGGSHSETQILPFWNYSFLFRHNVLIVLTMLLFNLFT